MRLLVGRRCPPAGSCAKPAGPALSARGRTSHSAPSDTRHQDLSPQRDASTPLLQRLSAACVAVGLLLGSHPGLAPCSAYSLKPPDVSYYDEALKRLEQKGGDRYMFTDDAWEGELKIEDYAAYVSDMAARGVGKGCTECEENRHILEDAWQVVANEFYDPSSAFTQSYWAGQLLRSLQVAGGAIETKAELYALADGMLSQLADPYSSFLPPADFRRALRRPLPVERSYLAAQSVGVGIQLGGASGRGGWLIDSPLAASPAEEAGLRRGDRLLAVDGGSVEGLSAEDVSALLRGPDGSTVTLTVRPAPASAADLRVPGARRRLTPAPPPPTRQQNVASSALGSTGLLQFPSALLSPSSSPSSPSSSPSSSAAKPGAEREPPFTLALERRPLPQPPLRAAQLTLPNGRSVTYVRIHYFSSEGTRQLRRLIQQEEARAAPTSVYALPLAQEDAAAAAREEDARISWWRGPGGIGAGAASTSGRQQQQQQQQQQRRRQLQPPPATSGYILDLRNNPGGVFEEAVAMATFFVPPGQEIVETVRNKEVVDERWVAGRLSPEIFPELQAGPLTRRPVVLLVNRCTASASEVLAGALQGSGRALLVGERTYGKGVVQYYFPMADGSGIKVTVAKYLTPGPYDITKKGGLQPDIACADFPHAPPPPPSATVATTTAGVDSTFPPGSSSSRRAAQAATRAALDADRCLSIAADRVARRALLPASAAMLPPPPLSP